MKHLAFCLFFILFWSGIFPQPPSQKITNLPGLTQQINFDQYAGYINVDPKNNRNLFYWFVQSQGNPSKDPLLLWLNGGPGASSLLGLLTEHGPFQPQEDGKTLLLNEFAWNKFANIIYLEAPAFVGFSYSDNATDAYTDDDKTAQDNYQFLLNWFKAFPSFKSNDFYVTGESYGGHYVPELADLILEGNKNGAGINMKGIAIGNPGIENDWYFNVIEYSFVTFMYTHGLIPQKAYVDSVSACGWDDFLTNCDKNFSDPSEACKAATSRALSYLPENIDYYDIYAPVCLSSKTDFSHYVSKWNPIFKKFISPGLPYAPCIIEFMTTYLNQNSVQQAIHARPTNWAWIGPIHYGSEMRVIVPYFKKFIAQTTWKIIIYSGDADSAVPFLGTQRWISCLNRPIKKDWYNWISNKQVAGSAIEYDGITFLTIKGAGHMVPSTNPQEAYDFFSRWLTNQL
jgi:serine carboxypeptidase-like clade 2